MEERVGGRWNKGVCGGTEEVLMYGRVKGLRVEAVLGLWVEEVSGRESGWKVE